MLIFSSHEGYRFKFSIPRAYFVYTVPGMALYWPILQFSVCRYVATPGECYYNILLCCGYFIVKCGNWFARFLCAKESHTQSFTRPAYWMPREQKLALWKNLRSFIFSDWHSLGGTSVLCLFHTAYDPHKVK